MCRVLQTSDLGLDAPERHCSQQLVQDKECDHETGDGAGSSDLRGWLIGRSVVVVVFRQTLCRSAARASLFVFEAHMRLESFFETTVGYSKKRLQARLS